MTTLAANTPRDYVVGDNSAHPVVGTDVIYEGAAVGLVGSTGYARPLVGGDLFAGFATRKADNASGSAGDINVEVSARGAVKLSVSGAVITDVGQPVYATDDDTFVFLPTGATFVGFVRRWVSSGVVIVEYDVAGYSDPYAVYGSPSEYETVSGDKTLDIQDTGKVFFVTADATTTTLPAIATPVEATVVNMGAYGTQAINISPNSADGIHAPDIGYTNNKDHINTKATAQRGDLVQLSSGAGDANGWAVRNQIGIWAQEG
jgi:hypothetical protein